MAVDAYDSAMDALLSQYKSEVAALFVPTPYSAVAMPRSPRPRWKVWRRNLFM